MKIVPICILLFVSLTTQADTATGFVYEDINGDGIVNVNDLLMVVGNWGPCL